MSKHANKKTRANKKGWNKNHKPLNFKNLTYSFVRWVEPEFIQVFSADHFGPQLVGGFAQFKCKQTKRIVNMRAEPCEEKRERELRAALLRRAA